MTQPTIAIFPPVFAMALLLQIFVESPIMVQNALVAPV
jgi:hypothetical protein